MQEQRFLLFTSFLVVLIGAPAVYSVVREPQQLAAVTQVQEKVTDVSKDSERTPANVTEDPNPRTAIKSKSVILDYSCKSANQAYEVEGTLVRFKGHSCIDENWKDISIVNETNGFTASVIFLKNKNFTTDFIDLKEGDNKLSIQATDENGHAVVQTFSVHRRFPASAENSDN